MKTRSSSGVGQKVDLEFDVDTLRIKDLEEEDYSSNAQSNKPSASILDGLKKTSTVVDNETGEIKNPNAGISIGKVKASSNSAQIRDIIKNLNSEKD